MNRILKYKKATFGDINEMDIKVYERDLISLLYSFCFAKRADLRIISDDNLTIYKNNNRNNIFDTIQKQVDNARNGYSAHLHGWRSNRKDYQYLTDRKLSDDEINLEYYQNRIQHNINQILKAPDENFYSYWEYKKAQTEEDKKNAIQDIKKYLICLEENTTFLHNIIFDALEIILKLYDIYFLNYEITFKIKPKEKYFTSMCFRYIDKHKMLIPSTPFYNIGIEKDKLHDFIKEKVNNSFISFFIF